MRDHDRLVLSEALDVPGVHRKILKAFDRALRACPSVLLLFDRHGREVEDLLQHLLRNTTASSTTIQQSHPRLVRDVDERLIVEARNWN